MITILCHREKSHIQNKIYLSFFKDLQYIVSLFTPLVIREYIVGIFIPKIVVVAHTSNHFAYENNTINKSSLVIILIENQDVYLF